MCPLGLVAGGQSVSCSQEAWVPEPTGLVGFLLGVMGGWVDS